MSYRQCLLLQKEKLKVFNLKQLLRLSKVVDLDKLTTLDKIKKMRVYIQNQLLEWKPSKRHYRSKKPSKNQPLQTILRSNSSLSTKRKGLILPMRVLIQVFSILISILYTMKDLFFLEEKTERRYYLIDSLEKLLRKLREPIIQRKKYQSL